MVRILKKQKALTFLFTLTHHWPVHQPATKINTGKYFYLLCLYYICAGHQLPAHPALH